MSKKVLVVSVVDGDSINHSALKILIQSLLRRTSFTAKDIVILSTTEGMTRELLAWLLSHEIQTRVYALDLREDKYKVKFLIAKFALQQTRSIDEILYLDADHVICSDFNLQSPEDGFLVSSEVELMDDDVVLAQLSKRSIVWNERIHYNSSLVLGRLQAWRDISSDWLMMYEAIKHVVPARFCEEIAFGIAAELRHIKLTPVSTKIQSCFGTYELNCAMFHYGGDSEQAKRIKGCLRQPELLPECLASMAGTSTCTVESWLIEQIAAIASV